jgi:seryl-tRNA synthetase
VLDLSAGPLRYAGWSSCFRREAGSYGKDTRGIIRVHWFDKVEMFSFCRPEETAGRAPALLAWEEEFLRPSELPYRSSTSAAATSHQRPPQVTTSRPWVPSKGTNRELHQHRRTAPTLPGPRRLAIRYRRRDGPAQPAADLNGTLCAIARTIAWPA